MTRGWASQGEAGRCHARGDPAAADAAARVAVVAAAPKASGWKRRAAYCWLHLLSHIRDCHPRQQVHHLQAIAGHRDDLLVLLRL